MYSVCLLPLDSCFVLSNFLAVVVMLQVQIGLMIWTFHFMLQHWVLAGLWPHFIWPCPRISWSVAVWLWGLPWQSLDLALCSCLFSSVILWVYSALEVQFSCSLDWCYIVSSAACFCSPSSGIARESVSLYLWVPLLFSSFTMY